MSCSAQALFHLQRNLKGKGGVVNLASIEIVLTKKYSQFFFYHTVHIAIKWFVKLQYVYEKSIFRSPYRQIIDK